MWIKKAGLMTSDIKERKKVPNDKVEIRSLDASSEVDEFNHTEFYKIL